uniref:Mitoguardin 1 n=1 Tax=Gadus morhua TaxID=8049 RepID=A0A8C5D2A6_GADMO
TSTMTHNTLSEPQLSVQGAALRMVDLPLSVYNSLAQVHLSTGTKKLVAATALGAVSLLFLARHFQRRKRHKKSQSQQWEQASFQFPPPLLAEQGEELRPVRRSLDVTLTPELPARPSHSQVKTHDSGSSCTCGNESICWDRPAQEDLCNVVSIPVTTPENLYIMGMELFEEALRSWEQALSFRSRQAEDEVSCGSIQTAEAVSSEFIQKLECLLQRAYRLQEEFEGALGESEPHSKTSSLERLEDVYLLNLEDVALKDSTSIASNDSFVSAAEVTARENELSMSKPLHFETSYFTLFILRRVDAMPPQLCTKAVVRLSFPRTELLECLGDTDFLAKLHCVRQACQLILSDRTTRTFLVDTGKKILSSIIVKAQKSPKRFEEVFEEMISFLEHAEHWENTEVELATRGIKHLNFYDIVLDFILMDSFEDLENPPVSIQNVVNNRWLNSSFKETAVASSCWSVLKQKRQHMKVPDGFIAHFYAVCEQISPALAWGFLGPKSSLHDFCRFFKDQVLSFLKDIFDLDKVRYSTVESLAEDMLLLLHRRSALLLSYLGADGPRNARPPPTGPNALTEGRDQ